MKATIKNESDAPRAEVYIYDTIGKDIWGDGYGATDFIEDVLACAPKPLDIHINSCGGDVFDAYAICTAIGGYEAETVAHIDGIAASAASYIAVACDKVLISEYAMFMIHRAWTMASGNCSELRQQADLCESIDNQICDVYKRRRCLDAEEVMELMDNETWFTADEAVSAGFADEIVKSDKSPKMSCDKAIFDRCANVPESVKALLEAEPAAEPAEDIEAKAAEEAMADLIERANARLRVIEAGMNLRK